MLARMAREEGRWQGFGENWGGKGVGAALIAAAPASSPCTVWTLIAPEGIAFDCAIHTLPQPRLACTVYVHLGQKRSAAATQTQLHQTTGKPSGVLWYQG